MSETPTDQPIDLVEAIHAEFSFLVDAGFRPTVENENEVRYDRNDGVFVRVFRDPVDWYVGFRVGLASSPRDALTAAELALLAGETRPRGEFPQGREQVRASLARSAEQLRTQGQRALAGDETLFEEASELRRAHTRRYTKNQ